MAQRLIARACDRFRNEITSGEAKQIVSAGSFDEVKAALGQVERYLAARQSLRNFDRIAPFLVAAERFSQVVEVVCNGTPYLPWIWVRSCLLCYQLASPLLTVRAGTREIYHTGE